MLKDNVNSKPRLPTLIMMGSSASSIPAGDHFSGSDLQVCRGTAPEQSNEQELLVIANVRHTQGWCLEQNRVRNSLS